MNCRQSLSFGIAMIAWVAVGAASEDVISPEQCLTSRQILKFPGGGKEEKNTWRLTRHWVGTLKVVDSSPFYQNDARANKDEPVRFNVFSSEPKMIDEWIFREGRFRASDVGDPADAKAYPSEEERDAERQAEIDAKDDALPEPLRLYVKARHHPGDSDLKSWFSVVRGFREHPDAVLLQQMIARLDDGTCEMSGMLNTLFQDHSFDKKIGAWNPRQRQQARRFLLDALPSANNSHSLEDAAMLALRETGVCSVNIDTEELWSKMSSRYTKDGTTATFGLTLKSCHAARAGEILRDDIRRRWKIDNRSPERLKRTK